MAARIRELFRAMGAPPDFTVVELGAGRREMAEAFAEWNYVPVDLDSGATAGAFTGVRLLQRILRRAAGGRGGLHATARSASSASRWRAMRFHWQTGDVVGEEADEYLRRYYPAPEEGRWYEVNLDALRWMERIAASLTKGYVLTIDYGYTRAESVRFPAGTLMGYRRHTAREDVLTDPGVRDITAHVNFTALEESGAACGLAKERFETLAQTLARGGRARSVRRRIGRAGTA